MREKNKIADRLANEAMDEQIESEEREEIKKNKV